MRGHVVITGGTRGLGFAMVRAFLDLDYAVTYSGTNPTSIEKAEEQLKTAGHPGMHAGVLCDISRVNDLKELYFRAEKAFGPVDIWINNAAILQPEKPFIELTDSEITRIFKVNVLGVMNACRVIFPLLKAQGRGALYNVEGFGANGKVRRHLTVYGTTKHAVRYFTRAFATEIEGSGIIIGLLNPGIIRTEMLEDTINRISGYSPLRMKAIRLLAGEPEEVAGFFATRICSNTAPSSTIVWLSYMRIARRLSRLLFVT